MNKEGAVQPQHRSCNQWTEYFIGNLKGVIKSYNFTFTHTFVRVAIIKPCIFMMGDTQSTIKIKICVVKWIIDFSFSFSLCNSSSPKLFWCSCRHKKSFPTVTQLTFYMEIVMKINPSYFSPILKPQLSLNYVCYIIICFITHVPTFPIFSPRKKTLSHSSSYH